MSTLLIRGGNVVNADREFRADVLCVDGLVAQIGASLARASSPGCAPRLAWAPNRVQRGPGFLPPTLLVAPARRRPLLCLCHDVVSADWRPYQAGDEAAQTASESTPTPTSPQP